MPTRSILTSTPSETDIKFDKEDTEALKPVESVPPDEKHYLIAWIKI